MPIVSPERNTLLINAELIDHISSEIDRIDRGLNEITKERMVRDKEAATVSIDSADAMKKSWTEFRSFYSTVLDTVKLGKEVWAETIGTYLEYADAVDTLARTAGTSAEDASRLIQVAEGMGITFKTLETIMKKMTMEGLVPNVETMAQLSDQYLAIQDPIERAKFLLDNFGQAGAEAGRLMEQGSQGIYAMNSAIDENMIITEEGLKQAEEYRQQIDQLTGSWEGLKISAGGEILPFIVSMLDKANLEIEEEGGLINKLKESWIYLLGPIGAVIGLLDTLLNKTKETSSAVQGAVSGGNTKVNNKMNNRERDSGGPGIAGEVYMIGTGAQPEAFIPSTNGTFVPNADKAGIGSNSISIVINNPKKETAEDSIRKSLKQLSYLRVLPS